MRSSKNRARSKNNRNRSVGNVINRVYDSSGPEGKVRGTPQQIIDKYNQLARDAQLSNDRVAAENFQQHAEHYLRLLGEALREQEAQRAREEREREERRERQEAERLERQRKQDEKRAAEQKRDDQGNLVFVENKDEEPEAESALVETPEDKSEEKPVEKPRRAPRKPRKPRATAASAKKSEQASDEAADDAPDSNGTSEAAE